MMEEREVFVSSLAERFFGSLGGLDQERKRGAGWSSDRVDGRRWGWVPRLWSPVEGGGRGVKKQAAAMT